MSKNIEDKYFLEWVQYGEDLFELAALILGSGKKFHCVTGIPRGGLIVAVYLSHMLQIPYIQLSAEMSPRDTLIVDDISDTGKTLAPYKEKGFTIVTLHRKDHTKTEPDFCVRTINKWVVYPYEVIYE